MCLVLCLFYVIFLLVLNFPPNLRQNHSVFLIHFSLSINQPLFPLFFANSLGSFSGCSNGPSCALPPPLPFLAHSLSDIFLVSIDNPFPLAPQFPPLPMLFFAFFLFLGIFPPLLSNSSPSSPLALRFSDIITKRVRVVVDPIRVILDEAVANRTNALGQRPPVCVLSLHRDECQGQRIRSTERIGWQDRLCLVWRCFRADGFGMRVQECWAGSVKSPIALIDREGCTRESSMMSTPNYGPLNQSAHSLGWLTIRLPHLDHIRLACAIKFCLICDPECREQTPPRKCKDSEGKGGEEWWESQLMGKGGEKDGQHTTMDSVDKFCMENGEKEENVKSSAPNWMRKKERNGPIGTGLIVIIWTTLFIHHFL